ncbi:MAG: T9SS type A sorting domain-containing protein [Bacteroidia bacterium]|nr:T9SS type A sorting domain-containing protein [Bacteroidia bacterium]
MRNYTILSMLLLLASFSFAQNVPVDFEAGGNGGSWTWTTFENGVNPPLEVVANPSKVAPNTSDSVAKFTALTTGNPWAGCETMHGSDIGTFTLNASTSTIKIMVYKPVISDVGIKLVEAGSGSLGEIKVANTKTNEWEELSFDFSSREGIAYDQIVIFMDFDLAGRTTDNICYFDNITFNAAPAIAEPTTGAADPTYAAANVISMFSGVYTDVTVDTWRTPWSNTTLTDVVVDGNDVKKYSAHDFVGIETVGANVIDASAMDHINLDVWSPNSTKFKIKIVDFGADGAFQGGDDSEHELIFDAPAQEEWVNYHIPLANFTGLTGKAHIAQMILASEPSGTSILYLDNVFYSVGSSLAEPDTAATDPTFAAENVISLFSGVYTDVTVDTWRTAWSNGTLTDVQVDGNDVKKYTDLDFVGIETVGANLVDASGMDHVNFDIWSPNSTLFKIKIVDFGADGGFQGGDDSEHELEFTAPATEEWINYRIPFSDFTGLTETSNIAQIILASQPTGSSVIYLDNFFFSTGNGASVSDMDEFNSFNIYPNPATEKVNIDLEVQNGVILDYAILNVSGQTVYTENVNAKRVAKSLNTSDFGSGIYFIKVVTENGSYTNRLIIQ